MKTIIIEDEKFAANHLEKMILKFDVGIRVLAKLESVEEAVNWLRENEEPDLIFLDIHLEDDLSFAIFDKVKVKAPIIFTTAYDEYAIRAFKLKSIDYLLKPIMQEDLNKSIDKYKDWNSTPKPALDVESLYQLINLRTPHYKDRFSVTVGLKIKTVETIDIAYFYSLEGITFLVTRDNREYTIDHSLDSLGDQLNPNDFFRINRQFLVGLKSIRQVHLYPKSRLKLELEPTFLQDVMVSQDKNVKFKEWLDS
ncbi:MAG: LytTR family DNA-binding domain-containing protein [Bacteroidetes bacterium]|nr:LytTR family DNA-binding domain-containing protein [Bacteroidota bacterium]